MSRLSTVIAVIAICRSVIAAPPAPPTWNLTGANWQGVVEQQTIGGAAIVDENGNLIRAKLTSVDPCVANLPLETGWAPNGFRWIWDIDDQYPALLNGGVLKPGEWVDFYVYVRADQSAHTWGFGASTTERRGQMTLVFSVYDYSSGELLFQHQASGEQRATMVVRGPRYKDFDLATKVLENPNCPVIVGSGKNGHADGSANEIVIVASVINTGGRTLRKIGAGFRTSNSSSIFEVYSPTGQFPTQRTPISQDPTWLWE